MDTDLQSIQQARELVKAAREAQKAFGQVSQEKVNYIVRRMAIAGAKASEDLARKAHAETGFGRVDSKIKKNLFATTTLHERMEGMKTCGIISRTESNSIWEVAVPMGVVAALVPSTNPTSTAMYKAIICAKARCGLVLSPHPRSVESTAAALTIVAEAAYAAGAPRGLFGCMTEVTLSGTNALLENPATDLILATGGTPMVRAAYSKGKPAYGVGSGNVPVYVDRSADVRKAAADIVYGASFDWGTLCSTERSVVADMPIRGRLRDEMSKQGAYFVSDLEAELLRNYVAPSGRLNVDQVGKPPVEIAAAAGFAVPKKTRALVAEATEVGKQEPLSMETLSPILTFYSEDGWEAGCERSIQVLNFGGIGHTLALHCTNPRIIEAFAIEKPAMRIVVNTVAALGSVGYTNKLFPAMTLGPGTVGGSITSDNISPLHLINIKRMAFETNPINSSVVSQPQSGKRAGSENHAIPPRPQPKPKKWMAEIEKRLRDRAGSSQFSGNRAKSSVSLERTPPSPAVERKSVNEANTQTTGLAGISGPLSDQAIEDLINRFKR